MNLFKIGFVLLLAACRSPAAPGCVDMLILHPDYVQPFDSLTAEGWKIMPDSVRAIRDAPCLT